MGTTDFATYHEVIIIRSVEDGKAYAENNRGKHSYFKQCGN